MNNKKNSTDKIFDENDLVQILSLDGGGLKGLYTISVLTSFEKQLGRPIADHFDIITGTSTGGLIALALSLRIPCEDIQNFYIEHGDNIFPNKGFFKALFNKIKHLFTHKYSSDALEEKLKGLLSKKDGGSYTLLDSKNILIIPTFLAGASKPKLFKTPHSKRYKSDWKLPMWAIGMATSSAPTYFPAFRYNGVDYIDGGVWANNPSMIAIIEAMDLGAEVQNIKLLNVGTTSSMLNCTNGKVFDFLNFKRKGILSWGGSLLGMMMEANSHATQKMYVHQLLAKGNAFVVDEVVNTNTFSLDKVDNSKLKALGESSGEHCFSHVLQLFSHTPINYKPNDEALSSDRRRK